jgi:hypothetical protein
MSMDALIFYLLLATIAVLLGWIVRLELKINRLLGGQDKNNLKVLLLELHGKLKDTDSVNEAIKRHLVNMEDRLRKSVQHVKTIRFNPFRQDGGNHSFTTAFLDEQGNGTVISSLYTREKVTLYAKPITNYQSEFELTEEERSSLAR